MSKLQHAFYPGSCRSSSSTLTQASATIIENNIQICLDMYNDGDMARFQGDIRKVISALSYQAHWNFKNFFTPDLVQIDMKMVLKCDMILERPN
jgi:hypothetical protein